MIPKECKRLAEVDFPIAVVSKHAAREKSIRHGHPSTLHLWWARRPLAACRAMLLALLLPDPCDPHCPAEFKNQARRIFENSRLPGKKPKTDADLRAALLAFIGDFADWDNSCHPIYLEIGRGLVKAAYPEETPLVVDPFAGGGSIPLEALRLGCDAFASDLNPVACLICKVLLEDIPRYGSELADALRRVGAEVKKAAEKELAEFYPVDPDGARPIAYLWARTVRCEAPNCGAEIPLLRSFWLCKKAGRRRALRCQVKRQNEKGKTPEVEFEIFTPTTEKDVRGGTVSRAKATCLCCNTVLPPERVRAQLAAQRGGADAVFKEKGKRQKEKGNGQPEKGDVERVGGARLLAVVTLRAGEQGRHYRLPTERDYEAVWKAQQRLQAILDDWERGGKQGLCPVPDEPLPPVGTLGFRVQRYGMLQWGDLFTARQKVCLHVVSQALRVAEEVAEPAVLALGKQVDLANALCPWESNAECPRNVMSNGRVKPSWDFAEGVITSESSGSFETCTTNLSAGVRSVDIIREPGTVDIAQAQKSPLPSESVHAYFTDPPYYDAIPYSALADFFLVWLKRTLPDHRLLRDTFDPNNPLSPKLQEAVQDETQKVNGRPKDRIWFEETMANAFAEGRRILRDDGVGCVVFAHKTTEGWEALLGGLIRGGWTISGSWPIATEMAHRLRARDSAALATSVHLVCRPRPSPQSSSTGRGSMREGGVGDWADVLRELPKRVGDWMERLQNEGIRGADLVFACIGPALEIFSRYSRVETAEGREVPLAEYLEKVWEVVGRTALEQVLGTAEAKARNGIAGALEEDARLTALFLWTLQATEQGKRQKEEGKRQKEKGKSEEEDDEDAEVDELDDEDEVPPSKAAKNGLTLPFDVVRRFAQPLGIHLDDWEGRIIETQKGVVRLLPVAERAKQLFGEDGAEAVAARLETHGVEPLQMSLFPEDDTLRAKGKRKEATVKKRSRDSHGAEISEESLRKHRGATTLDRVHVAMLLQLSGRANALRALLKSEMERGPDFLRLANALSALYPQGSDEKRLLDAMLVGGGR